MPKPAVLKLTMSEKMIQEVMDEWGREHPGHDFMEMGPKEFSDRLMKKIEASAEIVEGGNS